MLGDEQRFLVPEKIVTRQTADGIIATLDTDQYFSTNSVHTTRAKPTSTLGIRFILGVLNSKVVSFFYRSNYKEKEGAFPQVKVNKLRTIPIPNANAQQQTAIVRLVNKILDARKVDAAADTTASEHELDCLVYALYDLTPDEILIVEDYCK